MSLEEYINDFIEDFNSNYYCCYCDHYDVYTDVNEFVIGLKKELGYE